MREAIGLALVVSTVFIWNTGPRASQPQASINGPVVPVVATVTDGDHRLVSGLTPSDFEILDNGKPQEISSFDVSVRPMTVTVIVDRSDSMFLGPGGVRVAAERFVRALSPGDLASVCTFTKVIVCSTGFTTDHDELARDVHRSEGGFGSRLFDTMASAIKAMAVVPQNRRRVLLVLSDGEDQTSRTLPRTVIARAQALDVMVYGIGIETRYFDGDDFVDSLPDRSLMRLAAETGGGYFEPDKASDVAFTVDRIGEELHSQYSLAFRPTLVDGRAHRITVRTTSSTLKVRARRKYLGSR